jgi:aspartate kinase
MGLIVQKFGGSSLANAAYIHRAARRAIRTKLACHRVVLVVSAMGDSTDHLLDLAHAVATYPPQRELDMLLTTGEQVSIALMAMAIEAAGHEAISLTAAQLGLYTDSAHSRARIQRISRDRIDRELQAGRIVIVAGFQGIDSGGEITTMGRGASDTTAVALAGVLEAQTCEVYTDVDGVFTADPRMVSTARRLDAVSYDEMLELAAAGAGVMHPRAIEFGKKFNIPIHVRNARHAGRGTMIMAQPPDLAGVPVRGVTLREELALITIVGLPHDVGVAARIFADLARKQVLVDDIVQGSSDQGAKANLSFSVASEDARTAREVCARLAHEVGAAEVTVDDDVAKVTVVGAGLRSHAGVAAGIFETLAQAHINIEGISTSEIVISCLVRRGDGRRAVTLLHEAFGLGDAPSTTDAATGSTTAPQT